MRHQLLPGPRPGPRPVGSSHFPAPSPRSSPAPPPSPVPGRTTSSASLPEGRFLANGPGLHSAARGGVRGLAPGAGTRPFTPSWVGQAGWKTPEWLVPAGGLGRHRLLPPGVALGYSRAGGGPASSRSGSDVQRRATKPGAWGVACSRQALRGRAPPGV